MTGRPASARASAHRSRLTPVWADTHGEFIGDTGVTAAGPVMRACIPTPSLAGERPTPFPLPNLHPVTCSMHWLRMHSVTATLATVAASQNGL
jgi:hypothetical protein